MLAMDYTAGMAMAQERDYAENAPFFQDVLEIARRHKIMNPEKMRTEYAKVCVYSDMDLQACGLACCCFSPRQQRQNAALIFAVAYAHSKCDVFKTFRSPWLRQTK